MGAMISWLLTDMNFGVLAWDPRLLRLIGFFCLLRISPMIMPLMMIAAAINPIHFLFNLDPPVF
jgi:hypothetical protein